MTAEPFGYESWQVRKPAVESCDGVVASQHYRASQIGAEVLTAGGNAVDAALTAGMAIGVLEPWMSGLGGGGFMLVYEAAKQRAYVVDFGMRAPLALDPDDYPLVAGADADLFGWPAVHEGRNVSGPLSFAAPGLVAGYALALDRFGTRGWGQIMAPAVALAEQGLAVDWPLTLRVAQAAPALARDPECARVYLPAGYPPTGEPDAPQRIELGALTGTLRRLAEDGPQAFYQGGLAHVIAADVARAGGRLAHDDLANYRAQILSPLSVAYRDAVVHTDPGLSAGPTLARVLKRLAVCHAPAAQPDGPAFLAYADCLAEAYSERLAACGDSNPAPTCTTHLSVADRHGNLVALTQTLLSIFGAKVMLPATGILMNNGVMWFDPRPGRPNSMAPGKRPLSNMCPTLVECGARRFALGASGGRRILPAVAQLVSFLCDYGMDLDTAMHAPRIDASALPWITADARLPGTVVTALERRHQVFVAQNAVSPTLFASPNLAAYDSVRKMAQGAAFVQSPRAAARAAVATR